MPDAIPTKEQVHEKKKALFKDNRFIKLSDETEEILKIAIRGDNDPYVDLHKYFFVTDSSEIIRKNFDKSDEEIVNELLKALENIIILNKIMSLFDKYALYLNSQPAEEQSVALASEQNIYEGKHSPILNLDTYKIGDPVGLAEKKQVTNFILEIAKGYTYENGNIVKDSNGKPKLKNIAARINDLKEYFSTPTAREADAITNTTTGKYTPKIHAILSANRDTVGTIVFKSFINLITFGIKPYLEGKWLWRTEGQVLEKKLQDALAIRTAEIAPSNKIRP